MRESLLLPILRSQTQGELLARLFLNPDREFMISDLARTLKVSVPGLHHEVVRLFDAGYIFERREGRNRLIRANTDMKLADPLTDLLLLTYGPIPVMEELLNDVKGISRAFIYGSWAKRYSGVSGNVPNDIDVGIIGTIRSDDIYEKLIRAEETLGREINCVFFTPKDWKESSSLIKEIKRLPTVEITLE
jgi:DNA-binding transcriptional ArsR family regulator